MMVSELDIAVHPCYGDIVMDPYLESFAPLYPHHWRTLYLHG